jgi:hypothetical protein
MASLGPYGDQHVEIGRSAGGPAARAEAEQACQDEEADKAGEGDDDLSNAPVFEGGGKGDA